MKKTVWVLQKSQCKLNAWPERILLSRMDFKLILSAFALIFVSVFKINSQISVRTGSIKAEKQKKHLPINRTEQVIITRKSALKQWAEFQKKYLEKPRWVQWSCLTTRVRCPHKRRCWSFAKDLARFGLRTIRSGAICWPTSGLRFESREIRLQTNTRSI